MRTLVTFLTASVLFAAPPTIATKVAGLEKRDGFVPLYWDAAGGKLWIEISRFGQEFLYLTSLPAGVGSNDIGLDRGQLGPGRVVRWERSGPRVMLVQGNTRYRALSNDEAERKAVRDSFAESVLWGFDIAAEEDGRVLVDATNFYLRDVHGVAETLARSRQGQWRVDATRCAFYLDRTRNFPRNTEVEATITLTGGPAGEWLRTVSPAGDSVTVREHHSFIELPGPGFEPRPFDPRAGYITTSYMDFATPVSEPITKRVANRHRLAKGGHITYYLDRGAPEPIRTALLEGARWWNQAFEAAGYPNGFRVELLPEDADPMDVRYNVIQWVHRSTRGWSYGASVTDPRTGEILKGHVTLGSLRVRQDFLIAEAFLAPYEEGAPLNRALMQMSLDRLRQLSAHEVGHTLGLQHNYIASAQRQASVMDYPHPYIKLGANGVPDLSEAYAKGIGEWDKVSIAWGYGLNTPAGRERLLQEARGRGLTFLSDQDARPLGSAHPQVHLWDNGANAVDELNRFMGLRAKALERFGEKNIRPGMPMALLEDVLVPLYLSHRYQLEAAAKTIGGRVYSYALRGDGQTPVQPVPPEEQRRALDAVLACLKPAALALPERILQLIPPRPTGYPGTRELFSGHTGPTFDPLAAAEAAADLAAQLLLNGERAARLVEHHARDAKQPSLEEVLEKLDAATWRAPRAAGMEGEIQRRVEMVLLRRMMDLAADDRTSARVRTAAWNRLGLLKSLGPEGSMDEVQRAHRKLAIRLIEGFEKDPKAPSLPRVAEAPPGMPIGCEDIW